MGERLTWPEGLCVSESDKAAVVNFSLRGETRPLWTTEKLKCWITLTYSKLSNRCDIKSTIMSFTSSPDDLLNPFLGQLFFPYFGNFQSISSNYVLTQLVAYWQVFFLADRKSLWLHFRRLYWASFHLQLIQYWALEHKHYCVFSYNNILKGELNVQKKMAKTLMWICYIKGKNCLFTV